MDNIVGMFTGMDGRINRQKWWIGIIILAVVGFILSFILNMIFGVSYSFNLNDPNAMANAAGMIQKAAWVGLITWVLLAYPYLAIAVKRRHDRDNNGMDAIGFIVFEVIYYVIQGLGWTANILGQILGIVFLVYAIYMLVVLGFLKGTSGPNQFGPDPLGGAA
jgi:uncharacterized membrane protein YhaH (DUF805 family)